MFIQDKNTKIALDPCPCRSGPWRPWWPWLQKYDHRQTEVPLGVRGSPTSLSPRSRPRVPVAGYRSWEWRALILCAFQPLVFYKKMTKKQKKKQTLQSSPILCFVVCGGSLIPSSDSWGPTPRASHPGPSLLLTQIAVRRDGFIELLQALMAKIWSPGKPRIVETIRLPSGKLTCPFIYSWFTYSIWWVSI